MNERYLAQTGMLDFSSCRIQEVITSSGWRSLAYYDRIGAIYRFVRDEIRFGYHVYDNPDMQLKEHHQEMSPIKALLYRYVGRRLMNNNVKKIRAN